MPLSIFPEVILVENKTKIEELYSIESLKVSAVAVNDVLTGLFSRGTVDWEHESNGSVGFSVQLWRSNQCWSIVSWRKSHSDDQCRLQWRTSFGYRLCSSRLIWLVEWRETGERKRMKLPRGLGGSSVWLTEQTRSAISAGPSLPCSNLSSCVIKGRFFIIFILGFQAESCAVFHARSYFDKSP